MNLLLTIGFFALYGAAFAVAWRRWKPEKRVWLHLGNNVVRLLLSLIIILAYILAKKGEGVREFVTTFVAVYVVYLVAESCCFLRLERKKKKEKIYE